MLKKYENFKKISRSSECCFYQANIRQNMQNVLIKRIRHNATWNDMLTGKSLKVQAQGQFFQQALEIFKSNGQYFIVYDKPNGPSLGFTEEGIKKQLPCFYQILYEILNAIVKLSQQIQNLYILPEWIFLNRTVVKICHFQPYFSNSLSQSQAKGAHVFMYEYTKKVAQEQNSTKKFFSLKRIKNLNFNLGYIAYHLLTGKTTNWKIDEQDYESKIKQIQLNSEARILKQTHDQKLAAMVSKLLKSVDDKNESNKQIAKNQAFQQFRNYIKRKNIDIKCCRRKDQNFRIVQVSLEKLKLQNNLSKIKAQKKKKCIRTCCFKPFQEEPNPEQTPGRRFEIVDKSNELKSNRLLKIKTQHDQSHSNKKLTSKSPVENKPIVHKHKINASCHLPSMSQSNNKNLTLSKIKFHHNRSTMFRILNPAAHSTPKSSFKTQY